MHMHMDGNVLAAWDHEGLAGPEQAQMLDAIQESGQVGGYNHCCYY